MGIHPAAGTKAPVRVWTDPYAIEPQAARQLRNIGALPWVQGVAVMPDVHFGKGATVGSVIAMRQAVSPAAVGVDIGCGMSRGAHLADRRRPARRPGRAAVRDRGGHPGRLRPATTTRSTRAGSVAWSSAGWDDFWSRFAGLDRRVAQLETRARRQLGTLGGGNHFIEVCLEQGGPDEGRVWLMLHSGSRNIGKELAERHIGGGPRACRTTPTCPTATWRCSSPARRRWTPTGATCGGRRSTRGATGRSCWPCSAAWSGSTFPQVGYDEPISCHHNYVAEESYDGVDVLVTRKGAIRAGRGDLGIIPGSMGTGSYIVRGRGNPDAYCSASHGAGRRMSRAQAKRTFSTDDLAAQTAGVECRKDAGVVDEIPGAYKDITEVMAQQDDLVEVVAHLKQVVCVKG